MFLKHRDLITEVGHWLTDDREEQKRTRDYQEVFEDLSINLGHTPEYMEWTAEHYAYTAWASPEIGENLLPAHQMGEVAIAAEIAAENNWLREREGELETELDRLSNDCCEAMDDPMTIHYGAGSDVGQMYGEKMGPIESELERIWLELRHRGAEPWPDSWLPNVVS